MIRATDLAGRSVIDIDAAEKIGTVDKLILDPDGKRIAGFVLARGGGFPGNKEYATVPASAVHAIGPDAITVKRDATDTAEMTRLEELPRGSDVIGRKIITEDGRYLGKVDDLLIERQDGRIFGYVLGDHKGKGKRPYLPADANLKAGKDLIVASESAMRYEWKDQEGDGPTAPGRWASVAPVGQPREITSIPVDHVGDGESEGPRETNPHV